MNGWIKDIMPVLTAIIAGVAGWFVARYQLGRQESREKNELILQKLEELYQDLSRFVENLAVSLHQSTATNLENLASSVIPKHLMPLKPTFNAEPVSEDRIKALIGFYAPELSEDWTKLEAASGDFCEMVIRTSAGGVLEMLGDKKERAKTPNSRAVIEQLDKVYLMCEGMKKKVIEISKKYR